LTGTYLELLLALALFLVTHTVPALPRLRAAAVGRLGERRYLALYSLLSLAALGWLITAALAAPYLELWPASPWAALLPPLIMPAACAMIVAGLSLPNPLSVTLVPAGFSLERPGLLAFTRHPVLWGFALWAGAHLVANGDLAAAILFGVCLAFSLVGMIMLDRRRRRTLGEAEWRRLTQGLALARRQDGGRRALRDLPWRAFAAGLGLYAGLAALHPWVLGVPALPGWWAGR